MSTGTTRNSAPSLLPTRSHFPQSAPCSTGTARGWEIPSRDPQAGHLNNSPAAQPSLSPHLAPARGFPGPNAGEAALCTAQGKPGLQNPCPAPTGGQGRVCLSLSLEEGELLPAPCPPSRCWPTGAPSDGAQLRKNKRPNVSNKHFRSGGNILNFLMAPDFNLH